MMSKKILFSFSFVILVLLYVFSPTYNFPTSITASNNIDKRILKLLARHEMGGAYLISQNGEVKYEKYAGYKNYLSKTVLDNKSIFNLGTLSQQYTGNLYFELINKNIIDPDYKVDVFIPKLDKRFIGEQTIRELLTMKTHNPYNFKRGRITKWQSGFDLDRNEILKQISETTPSYKCPPDVVKGCYSQLSYTALGLVLESFFKKNWEDILKEKIFDKYSLTDTYFNNQNNENLVRGHYLFNNSKMSLVPTWDFLYLLGNSGMQATLGDFHKFQVSISDQLKRMQNPTKYFELSYFSFGWNKVKIEDEDVFWARGDAIGSYSLVVRVPSRDLIIIFLSNIDKKRRENFHTDLLKMFESMIVKF